MNSRACRVAACMGVRVDYKFAFKCIFRENSVKLVSACFLVYSVLFGYMFRICETPSRHMVPDAPPMDIRNSIWCAITSMTTVGYGDVVPYSGTGSYIGLLCSIIGIQTTAFFLISYQQFLEFDKPQKFSYKLLGNIRRYEDVKMKAKNHIVSYYKYKIRGSKRAKEIYRHTHSNTCTCVNICRTKFIEYNNYARDFKLFRIARRIDKTIRIQSITPMDLLFEYVCKAYKNTESVKERLKIIWMLCDPKQFSKQAIADIDAKFHFRKSQMNIEPQVFCSFSEFSLLKDIHIKKYFPKARSQEKLSIKKDYSELEDALNISFGKEE
ncbi:unnamed protein product [Moneuplotes crassus]|uniref:Potassium channel domain-containing protein n=1 Tax=Euplotes crassus TaxID=5936 RepID=A0AAD2D8E8_EUPCR|nr:unnamed protein product [Moneuplotes crassus]